jgi:hypothetical protein
MAFRKKKAIVCMSFSHRLLELIFCGQTVSIFFCRFHNTLAKFIPKIRPQDTTNGTGKKTGFSQTHPSFQEAERQA